MPVPPTHWLNLPGSVYAQTAARRRKELGVHCVSVLGNDDTARKRTPLIRARPGESHKRATVGLDILAAIGSDIA